jgi:hypothetical protein
MMTVTPNDGRHVRAVGPAAREKRPAVEAIVERAGKMKAFSNELFEARSVSVRPALIGRADRLFVDNKHLLPQENRAFVVYELRMKDGRRFRNAELVTIEGGKITDIEVYFGCNLPHEAPTGGFVDQQKR